jgi:thioester reductase-like protein
MADRAVFMTGAGGFIGRYLMRHYLAREDCDLFLLENGPFVSRLQSFIAANAKPSAKREIKVIEGDISAPGMGLAQPALADLQGRVTHAIHLAALYNLSAPRDISVRINVDGTRNVLDFLQGCPNLQRFAHTSTLAVAGDYVGDFTEDDFDKGQGFKNFYEETKFLSEKLVRERWNEIPTVVLRLAVVVGDSKTGEIEKIDGPYYALTMVSRHLHLIIPDSGPVKCHIAPVDFVTDGFYALFENATGPSGVYFLMDPHPLTYNEFFDLACVHWGKMRPILHVPPRFLRPIAQWSLFQKATGIPWHAFMYADQAIEYRIGKSTAALASQGIACPPLASYIDVMIQYFQQHHRDRTIRRERWWVKPQG